MDLDERLWAGMLRSCADDAGHQRMLLLRRAARRAIRDLLAPERITELSLERFLQDVCRLGYVAFPDGHPLSPDRVHELTPHQLERMLNAGELVLVGNQCVEATMGVCPSVLPGFEELRIDELRTYLRQLLDAEDPIALVNAAAHGRAPLTAAAASLVLCMCRDDFPIWTPERVAGLRHLELFTGRRGRYEVQDDYRTFTERTRMVRDDSGGALHDLLAVDAVLCRLAQVRPPRAWKISVGLTIAETEAAAVARQCLDHGFATIAPDDEDDPNLARMRAIAPGDFVVLHLRGRVSGIGRVTRSYYEIDRKSTTPLDRRWWRRIGVAWIPGERDRGSVPSVTMQRHSVVELDEESFRSIARTYRQSAQYDRLFGHRWEGWVLRCPDDRWRTLQQLERPLPLRDRWTVRPQSGLPEAGHRVFLVRDGEQAGICGIARVIAEPKHESAEDDGTVRLDLLYEHLLDPLAAARRLARDTRTASWRPPGEGILVPLTPEQAAAFSEALEVPPERLFLLFADGRDGTPLRLESAYHLSPVAAGQPGRLTAALAEGAVRCLIYHGAPEHAFVGFGTVMMALPQASADEGARPLELKLDMCRFTRRTGASHASATGPCPGADAHHEPGCVRTVLPVSAYDFYRVVGAGMGAATRAPEPATLEELARACGAPLARLEEIERLLRERGQMIFYGPPGTGKTWVALHLARHLVEADPTRLEVVQFHPSYSYEDFIEGIRPHVVEDSHGHARVTYPVVPGVFKAFCERARRNPHRTHVFLIDEINRAHVSHVFGELMLALEYREHEVGLAHTAAGAEGRPAGDRFAVPRNVLVLGTMNTADRSTALVDYALRRRFVFYPFFPDEPLVSGMFRTWLTRHAPGMTWVAELLALINERLEPEVGRHLLIGHTYLMRPELDEDTVRQVWRFQLLPLLEEYFAGMPERLTEFDINELIAQARARAEGRHHKCAASSPAAEPALDASPAPSRPSTGP